MLKAHAFVNERGALCIRLPQLTPSNNTLKREHWALIKEERQTWAWLLIGAVGRKARAATGKKRVTIERHAPNELDDDNLYGGCKTLIDAMRDVGLLVDDKPKWMELHARCVKASRADAHTRVIIEDMV